VDFLAQMLDFLLHVDRHLADLTAAYGIWMYAILFGVVFLETGVVVTPFLPGDSLLFAAGAMAAVEGSALDPHLLFVLLASAAMCGDSSNYGIGRLVGPRVFRENMRWLNRKHLLRTQEFYRTHGGKTVFLARFAPILRTFAPFVAGIGAMRYPRFLAFSVSGAICWVGLFVYAGYFFGRLPWVEHNFSLVVLAIIALSLLPLAIELLRARLRR